MQAYVDRIYVVSTIGACCIVTEADVYCQITSSIETGAVCSLSSIFLTEVVVRQDKERVGVDTIVEVEYTSRLIVDSLRAIAILNVAIYSVQGGGPVNNFRLVIAADGNLVA